jgi:hypothetical protein
VENAAKAREIRQRLRGLRAVGRGRVPAIPRRYPARFGARHWQALCFFDLKEHFVAIGLGLKKWGSSPFGSARVTANFLDGADEAKQFYL